MISFERPYESSAEFAGKLRTATLDTDCILRIVYGTAGQYDYTVQVAGTADAPVPDAAMPGKAALPVTLHMDCGCIFTADILPHDLHINRHQQWIATFVAASELGDTPTRCPS